MYCVAIGAILSHMKQLDPKAVWLFFISYVLRWAFVIIFIGIFAFSSFFTNRGEMSLTPAVPFYFTLVVKWGWLIIPLLIVLLYVWAWLTYRFYRYELREDGFRKESGVIYKRYVTIPYERIQNVDIYRGIWARILGLSDLQIQTAGASAVMGNHGARGLLAEGRLPGLSKETAEQLRDELVRKARGGKTGGV